MPHHTVTEAATARRDHSRDGGGPRGTRHDRSRVLRAAAAGLTAVAAFGLLTACGGQQALKTNDSRPFHPFGKDSGGSDEPLGTGMPSGARTDRAASGSHPSCDPGKVTLAAKPLPQPPGRLLLQVTNTSSAVCDLHGFPRLRTGDSDSAVTPYAKQQAPRAPLTLAPGATAYATLSLSTTGTGREARSLSVGFTDREGHGVPGPRAHVRLPGGYHLGGGARTTYWQHDPGRALRP
ncbi:DUF4232 domain-containing protein [Streptomyces sp. NPDC007100]|uniref:DUF4232 domain-containing protein n=1 Tax=Streptomyces sp. NPDC007100 TaxID=3155602 RepID=UPI0033C2FEDB